MTVAYDATASAALFLLAAFDGPADAWSIIEGAPEESDLIFRVTLPLLGPGLTATGVFAFIQAWNEFTFALVIMNRPDTRTLPVWLNAFVQATQATDWAAIMAGSILDEGDQSLVIRSWIEFFQQGADGLHDFQIGFFVPATNVIGFTGDSGIQHAAYGTAVIGYI